MNAEVSIPSGIAFGTKALVVPGLASAFTHSGYIRGVHEGNNYRWIKRGEAIGRLDIDGTESGGFFADLFGSNTHTAFVKSPVSGLLLHNSYTDAPEYSLKDWNTAAHPPLAALALLLPEGEPSPESGKYVFGDACRLVDQMRHYYLKASRYWTLEAMDNDRISALIDLQLNMQPRIFDASPKWDDYFREARIQKPALRPYLKHLP